MVAEFSAHSCWRCRFRAHPLGEQKETGSGSGTYVTVTLRLALPATRAHEMGSGSSTGQQLNGVSSRALIRPAHGLIRCAAAMALDGTVLGLMTRSTATTPVVKRGDGSKDEVVDR